ncbi:MAG: type II toxin-antitoxin system VapC family toxin [bacterium]
MILVDTSVWVDHLRRGNRRLQSLLQENQVLGHPFVVGELACGRLRNRGEILDLLRLLPQAEIAEHDEVLDFVESRRLFGQGLGWTDAHLLASAILSRSGLWTLDRALAEAAAKITGIHPDRNP